MSGVRGTKALGEVARAARLADANMPKSIKRKLSKMGPPAKAVAQEEARDTLPKEGGYAELVAAGMSVRVKSDTGLTSSGVTLEYTSKGKGENRDIPRLNKGELRHPVWGRRRDPWVAQSIRPGFWDRASAKTADVAHNHVRDVLDETVTILKNR